MEFCTETVMNIQCAHILCELLFVDMSAAQVMATIGNFETVPN